MKQKVVIKVSMDCQKSRSKALKIAVGVSGVESVTLQGQDKSQLEVIGDGVDAVVLTSRIRKNIGHAELVSVSPVGGEKKDEKKKDNPKKEDNKNQPKVPLSPVWSYPCRGVYQVYEVPNHEPSCSIL